MYHRSLQECTQLQAHLLTGDYLNIPVELSGGTLAPVFYDGQLVGIEVPEQALPLIMGILVGLDSERLVRIVADHPFNLLNFFSEHDCEMKYGLNAKEIFCHKLPSGKVIYVSDLYSEIIRAFAAHDPKQLVNSAEAIQKLNGHSIFPMLSTSVAGIDLASLTEKNRDRCRRNAKKADFVGRLEWKISIAQYTMEAIYRLPSVNIETFFKKSGALHPDYINSLMNDETFFWEGLFTAASGDETPSGGYIEPPRKAACHQAALHLFDAIEKDAPGTANHIIRSLNFTTGTRFDRVQPHTLEYLHQYAPPGTEALTGALLKMSIVKSHPFDCETPFIAQLLQLNRDNAYRGLDTFLQAPGFIVHDLLTEIAEMPEQQIGFNVFSTLGFISKQMLSEQEFSEPVVIAAMLKVAKALGNFVMWHAPIDTSKSFVDEASIQSIRDFNNHFLKPWGLDTVIFKDADPQTISILVAAGFDLPFDGVAPKVLTYRFEADLGL